MASYSTPGVYVQEISTLPPSIVEVATAVPAFVGYTAGGPTDTAAPAVQRISTLLEFETAFGGPRPMTFSVTQPIDLAGNPTAEPTVQMTQTGPLFALYFAITHYFRNGGGPCYVVSVGDYSSIPNKARYHAGLAELEKEDEPTLIVLSDAACTLSAADYYELCGAALAQCSQLGDRFTIVDVARGSTTPGADVDTFRNNSNLSGNLKYGAAYHPYLQTSIPYRYQDSGISVTRLLPPGAPVSGVLRGDANTIDVAFSGPAGSSPGFQLTFGNKTTDPAFAVAGNELTLTHANNKTGRQIADAWALFKASPAGIGSGFSIAVNGNGTALVATADVPRRAIPVAAAGGAPMTLDALKGSATAVYSRVRAVLDAQCVVLPPSAAMAGIYARVDREQGVWKAPANTGVMAVLGPVIKITDADQERLNVDATGGKSVNAIRSFTGKGTLVWGARTLAGNDNEWRYVSVRRLFIMIEESAKKASAFAVFEANDQSTWLKVKAMIESYLYGLWQQGALAGAKAEDAYFVQVGLGTTMTPDDVLQGRMVVRIGIAAVRPAEFILLNFSHKLQTA